METSKEEREDGEMKECEKRRTQIRETLPHHKYIFLLALIEKHRNFKVVKHLNFKLNISLFCKSFFLKKPQDSIL